VNVTVLQSQAKRWWNEQRAQYRLITSQFVIDEATLGDSEAAAKRLALLNDVSLQLPDDRVETIAEELISRSLMPVSARLDALHVASAALGGVQYLLTQNCRHIANAHVLPHVYQFLEEMGLPRFLICTPAEFLGDPDNGN